MHRRRTGKNRLVLAATTDLSDVWPIYLVPVGLFLILALCTGLVMYGLARTGRFVAEWTAWRGSLRLGRGATPAPLALPAAAPIALPPAPRVFVMPPVAVPVRQLVASGARASTS